ncbi:MAG TPA: PAS domain-containing sensor histidine kinase [Gemmatimonadaceae bacterium]
MSQEDVFATLSRELPEPLLAVDGRGRIVSANDDASHMLARDGSELIGMPLDALLWSPETGALDDLLRRGAIARSVAELSYRAPEEDARSADVTVWPLVGMGGPRVAVLLHDHGAQQNGCERVSGQAELEAQRQELGARADEAARHAGELKTALESRHRFYTSMSHELRTPVNAIVGYSELLLDGIYGELSSVQAKILRRSLRAAGHLQELVNDLLDLARIEEGRLDIRSEAVDLEELVEELLDSVRPLATEHEVALRHESQPGLPRLVSDPRRIRKILLHLLTNAIKYGGRGPVTIRSGITLAGDDRASDAVFIEVTDHGAGLAPDELERIFSEFVRQRNDSDGTGLGLSIARGLSQALGGTLVAESTPGEGSTFRLILPRGGGERDDGAQQVLPLVRERRH